MVSHILLGQGVPVPLRVERRQLSQICILGSVEPIDLAPGRGQLCTTSPNHCKQSSAFRSSSKMLVYSWMASAISGHYGKTAYPASWLAISTSFEPFLFVTCNWGNNTMIHNEHLVAEETTVAYKCTSLHVHSMHNPQTSNPMLKNTWLYPIETPIHIRLYMWITSHSWWENSGCEETPSSCPPSYVRWFVNPLYSLLFISSP